MPSRTTNRQSRMRWIRRCAVNTAGDTSIYPKPRHAQPFISKFSYVFGPQSDRSCASSDTQFFQKSSSHLKILGARWVTWNKFHTEDSQNSWRHGTKFNRPGFTHPWIWDFLNKYCFHF
jgi:hypothetical protein